MLQKLQVLLFVAGLLGLLVGYAAGSFPVTLAGVIALGVALLIEAGGVGSGRFTS